MLKKMDEKTLVELDLLRSARLRLQRGWTRGAWFGDKGESSCLIGSFMEYDSFDGVETTEFHQRANRIAKMLGFNDWRDATDWNDDQQTVVEILGLIDQAITRRLSE